jgi:hypothetical protein
VPIPGSTVVCRGVNCRTQPIVAGGGIPGTAIAARKVLRDPKARGWYCRPCADEITGRAAKWVSMSKRPPPQPPPPVPPYPEEPPPEPYRWVDE